VVVRAASRSRCGTTTYFGSRAEASPASKMPNRVIAERLVASGTLRRERGHKLFGNSGDRYPAVDLYDAARPRLLLNHVIRNREEMDLDQAVLAALLTAVGVEPVLGLDMNRESLRTIINSLLNAMPSSLQDLLSGIDETVASISLTIHR